ncbi:DUF1499 domain-containing protein [Salipaludibacillus agaradhaerens]|uniref:DUF1499 domain-containing protein n=1 Tax=Salipaludibacillus agaradhaerens TaxID=76935 RepID=A0A9Q4AZJ8_SALAG|nr:DUF1499 domain-containing protein [Salipaludibacillus agaradhaerens]UJW58601.1 DUF1499 domain-containing protein [Bacillus sp. A116_S68]MCR6095559.1 DUF1499 domain-containing protein [Salipaludibacillus agaradhaerens]MCR6107554.1 DUF1499 domain-containing protein [Salipaludibacillus agaradhaerens]MCR6114881.1 DUF1499 domain-containing protein [Salipaludibacillus agaradhaerens]MCR6119583.1 DUF1499 domain-containing protein [Salipaludibacillus agaradhaerens]
MAIKNTFRKIFSTSTETREHHHEDSLKTRYYKTMKDKAMMEVETMLRNRKGFEVASVSEDHGEIVVNVKSGKKTFVVATIIMVRPFRTAVDFSVSTETFLFTDFGHSRKMIRELYTDLDKRLQFVGTGLGDELAK